MRAYADTSLLVSLYALDGNSRSAADLIASAGLPVLVTLLGEVEATNALCLRLFRKELDPPKVKAAQSLFRQDLQSGVFDLRPLSFAVFETANRLSEKQTPRLGTRALDVLHVASALVLGADTFLTFDKNQGKLARAEGLTVL